MMIAPAAVRALERINMATWSVHQQEPVPGWIALVHHGYTRRANSVYPIAYSESALEPAIDRCESFYQAHGLAPCFRLTDAASPPQLADTLVARGYRSGGRTWVQTLALNTYTPQQASALTDTVTITPSINPATWTAQLFAHNGRGHARRSDHEAVIAALQRPYFATIGQAALAMVVIESTWAVLYDVLTVPQYRQQGYGRALIHGILSYLQQQTPVQNVTLSVGADNVIARRLYDHFGFVTAYDYSYYQRDDTPSPKREAL